MIQNILPYLQAVLTFANICVMGYVFIKFLGKPHDTLEERVEALEDKIEKLDAELDVRQRDIENQLRQGNDKFRSHEKILEVLLTCTLALINFEVHYCETEHKDISEDLEGARKELNKCLAKINKEDDV